MLFILYIIIFNAFGNQTASLIGAFLMGIMKDLWEGERLGVTSLVYVCIAFSIQLYKRKFNAQSPLFLIFSGIVATGISEIINMGWFLSVRHTIYVVSVSVGTIFVWFLFRRLWGSHTEKSLLA